MLRIQIENFKIIAVNLIILLSNNIIRRKKFLDPLISASSNVFIWNETRGTCFRIIGILVQKMKE